LIFFPVLFFCSVGRLKRQMAEICVKAVLAVADLPRRDVNLELIKVCSMFLSLHRSTAATRQISLQQICCHFEYGLLAVPSALSQLCQAALSTEP